MSNTVTYSSTQLTVNLTNNTSLGCITFNSLGNGVGTPVVSYGLPPQVAYCIGEGETATLFLGYGGVEGDVDYWMQGTAAYNLPDGSIMTLTWMIYSDEGDQNTSISFNIPEAFNPIGLDSPSVSGCQYTYNITLEANS